jgi:hypothetical protein
MTLLQTWYNLSGYGIEEQVHDPFSWIRCYGLRLEYDVPDDSVVYRQAYNVLETKFFNKIAKNIIRLDNFEETGDSDIQHQHINSSELLKVLLSNEIKEIIGNIFSCRIVRKKDQYPSIRVFPKNSVGLGIHNDEGFEGHMTAFLYIEKWSPGMGGEVGLFEFDGSQFIEKQKVPPLQNSLLLMPITPRSFHCVHQIRGEWRRMCAFFPLTIVN